MYLHIGVPTLCFQSKKSDGILVKRERETGGGRENKIYLFCVDILKQSSEPHLGAPALSLAVATAVGLYLWVEQHTRASQHLLSGFDYSELPPLHVMGGRKCAGEKWGFSLD